MASVAGAEDIDNILTSTVNLRDKWVGSYKQGKSELNCMQVYENIHTRKRLKLHFSLSTEAERLATVKFGLWMIIKVKDDC